MKYSWIVHKHPVTFLQSHRHLLCTCAICEWDAVPHPCKIPSCGSGGRHERSVSALLRVITLDPAFVSCDDAWEKNLPLVFVAFQKFRTDDFPGFFVLVHQLFRHPRGANLCVVKLLNDGPHRWFSMFTASHCSCVAMRRSSLISASAWLLSSLSLPSLARHYRACQRCLFVRSAALLRYCHHTHFGVEYGLVSSAVRDSITALCFIRVSETSTILNSSCAAHTGHIALPLRIVKLKTSSDHPVKLTTLCGARVEINKVGGITFVPALVLTNRTLVMLSIKEILI